MPKERLARHRGLASRWNDATLVWLTPFPTSSAADSWFKMAKSGRSPLDGHRLFYKYLQKDLLESDVWLF